MPLTPRWIQPIEEDVVSRIQDSVAYLAPGSGGTCKAVGNMQTFLTIGEISPPFALVKYDGEIANPPRTIGRTASHQVSRFNWAIFVGALSFSSEGEGRTDNVDGNIGAYTIFDDIYWALEGYLLPHSPQESKLFLVSNTPPGVEAHRVTSISTWYCDVTRIGNPLVNPPQA